jgi:Uma2 family endonuclease
VIVFCGDLQYHDRHKDVLLNPRVIIEALSEETKAFDRGEKFRRYLKNLPSLNDYVLVSQARPFIYLYRRGENGEWILNSLTNIENKLVLRNIECRIPLREIYDRVEFPAEELSKELYDRDDQIV